MWKEKRLQFLPWNVVEEWQPNQRKNMTDIVLLPSVLAPEVGDVN